MSIKDRLLHAWNAFSRDEVSTLTYGASSSYPQHTNTSASRVSSKSFAGTVFNKIALDASMVDIFHVKIDSKTENETKLKSGIQECLTTEANIDQNSREFIQDIVYSMFDEGVVAVVPIDTTINPSVSGSFDIQTMRVGKIVEWFPQHVRVDIYNEKIGRREQIVVPKSTTAILENPLYPVVNGTNSVMKRLSSKMNLLDIQDERMSGGKLDLVLQLPYSVKGELKLSQAKTRISDLEKQLNDSRYGIAYVDGTEKITQLNRPITNNLNEQIQELKQELYNQLGLTSNVFNGTASETEMRIYYNRSIDPIIARIVAEFKRKFITKTARTQGQTFIYRRDLFKLIPAESLANIADTFTRNAILSPNEMRALIGYGPNAQPESDMLINRNIADKNQRDGSVASPDNRQNGYNTKEGAV